MENFIVRYENKIQGTLSCLDRIVFTGIIPGICYADGMSSLLRTKDIRINVKRIHRQLDRIVGQYCPVIRHFANGYHWSIMQIEYATDIIFKRKSDLKPIYDEIVRTAIHSVKPENIATFLFSSTTEGWNIVTAHGR